MLSATVKSQEQDVLVLAGLEEKRDFALFFFLMHKDHTCMM